MNKFITDIKELDGSLDLFGWKLHRRGEHTLVTIYVEDDEVWHEKLTLSAVWLDELKTLCNEVAKQI